MPVRAPELFAVMDPTLLQTEHVRRPEAAPFALLRTVQRVRVLVIQIQLLSLPQVTVKSGGMAVGKQVAPLSTVPLRVSALQALVVGLHTMILVILPVHVEQTIPELQQLLSTLQPETLSQLPVPAVPPARVTRDRPVEIISTVMVVEHAIH